MKRQIFSEEFRAGAQDAFRLYVALFCAPFHISKAFVTWPAGEPFRWPPETGRTRASADEDEA